MLKQITAGTGLPITLADIKRTVATNTTDDDQLLTDLIYSVCDMIERETGKVLRAEVWQEIFDLFPGSYSLYGVYGIGGALTMLPPRLDNPIFKPSPYWDYWKIKFDRSPVTAVDFVKYYDSSNTQITMSSSDYYFLSPSFLPAYIAPKTNWPDTFIRPDAITIQYQVGYTTLPPIINQGLRSLVATLYKYRESESDKKTYELNLGISRILERIRNV